MATSAPKPKQAAPEEAQDTPKNSKKKLFIIIGAVLVLAGGGGGWFYMNKQKETDEPKVEAPKPPVFHPMETFTVNLSPAESGNYLQTDITLQVEKQEDIDTIKLYLPVIRSRLNTLLMSQTQAQLSTPEGKDALAQQVIEQITTPYGKNTPTPKVTGVHFTRFVIQ